MSNTASIYIIGPDGGPYKVGWSKDPKSRLGNLQVGQAVEVKIHYQQETDVAKAKIIEKMVHRQLAHKRIRGEWFSASLEDIVDEVRYAFIRWEDEDNLILRSKLKLI
jgi:hypothetical protein